MTSKTTLIALIAAALFVLSVGCATATGQESVGSPAADATQPSLTLEGVGEVGGPFVFEGITLP